MENSKKRFIKWIKAHKRELILSGICISTLILVVIGLNNRKAMQELWVRLTAETKTGKLYSDKWFETVSDAVLDEERERVRVAYCSSGDDDVAANALYELLWRFDNEIGKRAWAGRTPTGPAFHREHGWYLANDD